MQVKGFEKLDDVLSRSFRQAADGKGAERHGNGKPFHQQPMQVISELVDSTAGMEFQAIKKLIEAKRLPTVEAQVRELLGAINYIAGIVIFLEAARETEPIAANDNFQVATRRCCGTSPAVPHLENCLNFPAVHQE